MPTKAFYICWWFFFHLLSVLYLCGSFLSRLPRKKFYPFIMFLKETKLTSVHAQNDYGYMFIKVAKSLEHVYYIMSDNLFILKSFSQDTKLNLFFENNFMNRVKILDHEFGEHNTMNKVKIVIMSLLFFSHEDGFC